jgi:acetoin utilization protein AcuB
MIVGMWMARNLVTIEPDTPISEAVALMRDNRIRRLPVTQRHGDNLQLVGLITATDIYRALPAHCNPFAPLPPEVGMDVAAAEIMSRQLCSTSPETPIEDAAAQMLDAKIGALPVLHENRLIGLITESDMLRAFISILRGEAVGARVTFSIASDEDVFSLLADRSRCRQIQVQSVMSSRRDNQATCVAHISGPEVQQTIDDLWKSGHQVLNVLKSR